jgi:hypothetical protein
MDASRNVLPDLSEQQKTIQSESPGGQSSRPVGDLLAATITDRERAGSDNATITLRETPMQASLGRSTLHVSSILLFRIP